MNKRLVKGFLVACLGLLIMITLISLLIPSKVMVSKAVVVHAPAEKIAAQITNLNQWKNWHPIFKTDSSFAVLKENNKETIVWKQGQVLHKLRVTEKSDRNIKFIIEREGEKASENIISVLPTADNLAQQVEWTSINFLKWYPWQKFAGIFLKELTGPGYLMALENIRNLVEGRPNPVN